jgi:HEAT repeat protein
MSHHRWVLRALLTSLLLIGGLGRPVAGQSVDKSPIAGGGDPPFIRVEEGVVTVKIAGASLEEVLNEIRAQSRIRLVLHGSRPETISAEFQAVPLDEALRRLIKANFLLLYSPDGQLVEVWVLRQPGERILAGERESLDSLIGELQRGEPAQRSRAALALGEFKNKQALAPVMGALEGDDAPEVRQAAISALEDLGGQQAIAALAAAVSGDSDDLVRLSAVEALAKLGGPEAIEPLTRALRADAEFLVRYEALVNLAELGDDRVRGSLLQALDDPEEFIREKAQEILQQHSAGGREP